MSSLLRDLRFGLRQLSPSGGESAWNEADRLTDDPGRPQGGPHRSARR